MSPNTFSPLILTDLRFSQSIMALFTPFVLVLCFIGAIKVALIASRSETVYMKFRILFICVCLWFANRVVTAEALARIEQRPMVRCDDRTMCAYFGDLDQKYDVQRFLKTCSDQERQVYISAKAQAAYLRRYYPELVPPPPANDHTVSTVFECLYHDDTEFRRLYNLRKLTRAPTPGRHLF